MLADTLVVCLGEFGQSPKINRHGGRDHWPHAQTVLLAGAGAARRQGLRRTDRNGAYPADQPVTPPDLAATILHLLGVPLELELTDRLGRPLPACYGTPVRGLLT